MYSKCGDSDIMTIQNKHIDPVLKLLHGVPLMITSNTNLKKGLGNGTRIIGLSIQLKKDCIVDCKSWHGRLIHTVSCSDVEYMVCETIPNNKSEKPKKFKLLTESDHVSIRMKVANIEHKINARMLHFGVNSNKTTTGHKLQGASLNRMVVRSWSYTFPNRMYVALSRVRTFEGLFICEKIDESKKFHVDPKLLEEEDKLRQIETKLINFLDR